MNKLDTLIDTLETLDRTGEILGKPFMFDASNNIGVPPPATPCGCIAVICKGLRGGGFYNARLSDIAFYIDIPHTDARGIYYGALPINGGIRLQEAIDMLKTYRETGIVDWAPVKNRWEREAESESRGKG